MPESFKGALEPARHRTVTLSYSTTARLGNLAESLRQGFESQSAVPLSATVQRRGDRKERLTAFCVSIDILEARAKNGVNRGDI